MRSNRIESNQLKFISSKPKYKITQTKTIQLVSYGVKKVLKDTDTFPQKRKQIEKRKQQYAATDTGSASTLLVSNKFNSIKVTSESLNCTTLHKAFRERVPYVDIAGNKRVQTSIDVTMGFNNLTIRTG